MRIKEKRFSVPFSALDDDLPDPALRMLLILLSKSDFNGSASVSYAEFRSAGLHSDATVSKAIDVLTRKKWIFHRRRSYGRPQVFWLQIPARYRVKPKTAGAPIAKLK